MMGFLDNIFDLEDHVQVVNEMSSLNPPVVEVAGASEADVYGQLATLVAVKGFIRRSFATDGH